MISNKDRAARYARGNEYARSAEGIEEYLLDRGAFLQAQQEVQPRLARMLRVRWHEAALTFQQVRGERLDEVLAMEDDLARMQAEMAGAVPGA